MTFIVLRGLYHLQSTLRLLLTTPDRSFCSSFPSLCIEGNGSLSKHLGTALFSSWFGYSLSQAKHFCIYLPFLSDLWCYIKVLTAWRGPTNYWLSLLYNTPVQKYAYHPVQRRETMKSPHKSKGYPVDCCRAWLSAEHCLVVHPHWIWMPVHRCRVKLTAGPHCQTVKFEPKGTRVNFGGPESGRDQKDIGEQNPFRHFRNNFFWHSNIRLSLLESVPYALLNSKHH